MRVKPIRAQPAVSASIAPGSVRRVTGAAGTISVNRLPHVASRTGSRLCAKLLLKWSKPIRQSIEALRLVFRVAVFFLSLTMGLTTICVCPPKYAEV
jgi:hypothetical protein